MYEKARDFRAIGRRALSGNWFAAVIAAVIAGILGGNQALFSINFQNNRNTQVEDVSPNVVIERVSELPPEIKNLIFTVFAILSAVAVIQFFIGGAIELGYKRFNIEMVKGYGANLGAVLSRLPFFFKALLLRIIMAIFVFLWSLLFIIPGIIAAYSYSMTFYIMAENPDISIMQAIRLSKEMMRGNKWRLFCLQFSFLGWIILGSLTVGIGFLWVNPYICASEAAFYKSISAHYYSMVR